MLKKHFLGHCCTATALVERGWGQRALAAATEGVLQALETQTPSRFCSQPPLRTGLGRELVPYATPQRRQGTVLSQHPQGFGQGAPRSSALTHSRCVPLQPMPQR